HESVLIVHAEVVPVVAQHFNARGNVVVLSRDDAGVAGGAKYLRWRETKTAGVADGSDFAAAVCRSGRERGVLDHAQPFAPGDVHDGIHVRRVTEQVDGKDRLGPARDSFTNPVGSQVERLGADVDPYD